MTVCEHAAGTCAKHSLHRYRTGCQFCTPHSDANEIGLVHLIDCRAAGAKQRNRSQPSAEFAKA